MARGELLKGHKPSDIKKLFENLKVSSPFAFETIRPAQKYIEALEKEVRRLDEEVYSLRKVDMFSGKEARP